MMTLAELAAEYSWTLANLLAYRKRLKAAGVKDTDPEVRVLKEMIKTTREIRNTCRDYYKKEARLNDDYTVRYTLQRASGRSRRVDEGKRVVKRGFDPKITSKSRKSDSRRVDPSTAAGLAALLIQQMSGPGDRPGTGG